MATEDPAPPTRVDVLGPLRTDSPPLAEHPRMRELVAALAVAGRPVPRGELCEILPARDGTAMSRTTLKKRVQRLGGLGAFVLELPEGLVLRPGIAVDAQEFVAQVGELARDAPAERLVELMAMWRDDPRTHLPVPGGRSLWTGLMLARAVLVERLVAAGSAVPREQVRRFVDLFPGHDADLAALRPGRSAGKRLLVVDDTSATIICERIEASTGHRCIPLDGIAEWWAFVNEGRLAEVDAVLVDYHLQTGCEDRLGQNVAVYLRDKTMIPASLLTIRPPTVWPEGFQDMFRLVDVAYKGYYDDENLDEIARTVVPRLLGDDDETRRMRLRLFLKSAYLQARAPLARPDARPGQRLAKLDQEHRAAAEIVERSALDRAAETVERFRADHRP